MNNPSASFTPDGNATPGIQPLLANVDDLSAMLKLSRAKIYSMLSSGKIGPMPLRALGKRTLFDSDEIRRWVQDGRCCSREEWVKLEAGR